MSDLTTQAVIALSIALVVWYFMGSQINRRRAGSSLRWIREGVQVLGGQATMRPLGTSGFQVNVEKTKGPFKKVEMMVLLESREMLLFWIFNRLRGQRDLLVLKSDLRARPKTELEVIRKGARMAKKALKAIDDETWVREEIEDGKLIMAHRGKARPGLSEKLTPLLREYTPYILTVSLRKSSPHLLANLSLSGLEKVTAEALFGLLKEMVEVMASSDTGAGK